MRKLLLVFCLFIQLSWALDRQPNADYHARRQALASKIKNGVVLLFAPNEAEGPNDLYGYRPNDNFFYLSGWPEPGAALLIAASPEHPYTEILFLPDHNPSQEKWTGPKLAREYRCGEDYRLRASCRAGQFAFRTCSFVACAKNN